MRNRLILLRENFSKKQSEFAKMLGITQAFLSEIEKGKRNLSLNILLRLSSLNVNLDWLITGEGSMFKEKSGQAETELFDFDLLNSIVKELPLRRQKRVLEYAEDQRDISKLLHEQNSGKITEE